VHPECRFCLYRPSVAVHALQIINRKSQIKNPEAMPFSPQIRQVRAKRSNLSPHVIPAKAGIQSFFSRQAAENAEKANESPATNNQQRSSH